jgi:hypothetical protein
MSAETASNLKFEIGHVLFIDIVGYSKLLINEQSEQIQKLKRLCAGLSKSASLKPKVSYCAYRLATAAHLFFAPVRKRPRCARSKLARH